MANLTKREMQRLQDKVLLMRVNWEDFKEHSIKKRAFFPDGCAPNRTGAPVHAAGRLLGRRGTPDGFYPPRLTVAQYCTDMHELSEMCCRWPHDPLRGSAAAVADRARVARAYADVLSTNPNFRGQARWVLDYHGFRRFCGRLPH